MMETMFELRSDNGLCRLFDFFADAMDAMKVLVGCGDYREDELYITRVVTE